MGERDSDSYVRRIGEGFLDRSLPEPEWTHAAHFAATLYLLRERPDINIDRELPGLIQRYNEATRVVNDDHGGYHETITRVYLAGVREFLSEQNESVSLGVSWERLMDSEYSAREYPLKFYSRERLFSVEARRTHIEPDLADQA